MSRCTLLLLVGLAPGLVPLAGWGQEPGADRVSFSRQVAPLLIKHCQACHGPRDPQGGYQLGTFELLQKPGDSAEAPLAAGAPDDSPLWALVSSPDADERMPKDGDPLAAAELKVLRQWIAEGAVFDGPDPQAPLASYAARPPHPAPPAAYPRPLPVTSLAFSPSGEELAVGGYHEVLIYRTADGQLARRLPGLPQRIYSLAWTADAARLAVAGGLPGTSGEVRLVAATDGGVVKELGHFSDVAFRAVLHPAGSKLAVAAADRTIRIYDLASLTQERVIEDHADWVLSVAWSPDGSRLASASRDKTAKLYDAATGDGLTTYSGHGEPVFGVAFSPDGKRVITAGADRKLHAWGVEDGAKKAEAGGFGREITALVAHEGTLLAAAADGGVQQFQGDELKTARSFGPLVDAVYALAFHAGSGRLAAAGYAGQVQLWKVEDGAPLTAITAAPGWAPPAASP